VVGAGPAGLAFATTAARRGLGRDLFDAAREIGGQFNVAKQVPGKEEFYETLRYFGKQIEPDRRQAGTGPRKVSAQTCWPKKASSRWCWPPASCPRKPEIEGIDHPKVLGYLDVLRDKKPWAKVALIGAGGIGFDVPNTCCTRAKAPASTRPNSLPSGVWTPRVHHARRPARLPPTSSEFPARSTCCSAKPARWAMAWARPRAGSTAPRLKNRQVEMIPGVTYRKVDDAGLHITVGDKDMTLPVDNVILCAGQDPSANCRPNCKRQAAPCT
jgi:2,4-dienoyl-CoA reductase (NADPH2)